jgi:hypothetical protein
MIKGEREKEMQRFCSLVLCKICLVLCVLASGCQVANTMFQLDSDSSSPQFGVNLIPSKGWWGNRGISYNKRKIEYHGKQNTGSIEVIDLPAAPERVRDVRVHEANDEKPLAKDIVKLAEPVAVILPGRDAKGSGQINTAGLFSE